MTIRLSYKPGSPEEDNPWKLAFYALAVIFAVWFMFNWLATDRWFQEMDQRHQCEAVMDGEMVVFRDRIQALRDYMEAQEAELAAERARFQWDDYPEEESNIGVQAGAE